MQKLLFELDTDSILVACDTTVANDGQAKCSIFLLTFLPAHLSFTYNFQRQDCVDGRQDRPSL